MGITCHTAIELLWIVGFAASSVLSILIVSSTHYRKYSLKKQFQRGYSYKEFVKHQMEFEKWKRKVLRP
jgi:hypothetical protein